MGTPLNVSAPVRLGLLAGMVAIADGCGGGSPTIVASHSPTPSGVASHSPAASPSGSAPSSPPASPAPTGPPVKPINASYGVLVSSPASSPYTISIVGVDGKVVASAQATTPTGVSCGSAAGAVVPVDPVSASDSRVYFQDAQGGVHFLGPAGDSGQITTVPAGTSTRRSMFSVSPDDHRIAVVVDDFNTSGAATRVYVEDLVGGGHHLDLFSETGASTLWPVGWHGTNNLVLAKTPSCTQGGGPFTGGPMELHVVDPDTANRRFTLGGSGCVIAGAASPAGVVCERQSDFMQATVLNWTAGVVKTLAINGPAFAYLSPDGGFVAMVDNSGTSFTIGAATIPGMFACGWIDKDHVLSGGDAQHQPRVAAVVEGSVVPVAAQGDCGGRIPGGL